MSPEFSWVLYEGEVLANLFVIFSLSFQVCANTSLNLFESYSLLDVNEDVDNHEKDLNS